MKKNLLLGLIFALFAAPSLAQPMPAKTISSYFGTWQLVSVENTSKGDISHRFLTEKMALQQIGKQLIITKERASLPKDLMWSQSEACLSPHYNRISVDEVDGRSSQGLLPDDHLSKRPGDFSFFEVWCQKQKILAFEVTKDDKLSVFYDSYFFFFSKVTTNLDRAR